MLDYLQERNVSPFFLVEIDQFLAAHPEIAQHREAFAHEVNYTRPLTAYRFFVRGYTRPARYIDGVSSSFATAVPVTKRRYYSTPALQAVGRVENSLTSFVAKAFPDLWNIKPVFDATPLALKHDEELIEFFNGYEYRIDILQQIDREVSQLSDELYHGQRITYGQRKLIAHAVYGNLVDAYKFYEYNYQKDWLPHRYLAEHSE